MLADLRAAGVRFAVATSKAEPTARRILDHFGLTDHFEVIAGASVDGLRSSKADVVAHALAQLDPVPARVLMVGDRAHDVAGAAEHGIDTVVVGWVTGPRTSLEPDVAVAAAAHVHRCRHCARCSVSELLHVTFVCSGNICRSPMAEKMFAHQIRERGLGRRGAGEQRGHRRLACRRRGRRPRQPGAAAHGYPTGHRAAQVCDEHLAADLVIAFGRNHCGC